MSIYGKAAQFLGKVKGSNGFGFVPKAKQAAKKMYGYGRENPGQAAGLGAVGLGLGAMASTLPDYNEMEGMANSEDAKVFKAHTEAWLRLTEFPGAFDKRRWNWKKTTDVFMQDPDYIEFLKAQTIEDKYNIIKDKLHPAFDGSQPQEIMSTISNRLRR